MALRVWLPLDGSLVQQGSASVTAEAHGPTITPGKIGNCYQFDGADDYIELTGEDLYSIIKGGSQPFSIAMWVYHADSTRAILFGDYGLDGTIGFNLELNTSHSFRFYWNSVPDYFAATNMGTSTWTHLVVTYDGSRLKFYKNGTLIATREGAIIEKTKSSGSYYLGRDSRTGSTALNGRLNDFRIYDHCLSDTEVLEIAQGLVLHLKLDDYQQFSCALFDVQRANEWTADGCTVEQYDSTTIKMTDSNTGNRRIYYNVSNLWNVAGATYRVSIKAKADVSGTILRLSRSLIDYSENITLSTSYTTYTKYITISAAATNGTISLQSNTTDGVIYFQDLTIDRVIAYDSSGYGHNGYHACGNDVPATVTDSTGGRYFYKANFNATNKKVIIPNLITSGFGSTYTFAWWSCQSTFASIMNWGFLDGVRLNGLLNGNLWNTNDGSNNPLYNPGTTTQVTVPTAGVWYHWAMVADGTTCKVYKNGELWAQAKTFKTISGTTIILNGFNTSTSYSCSSLKMSDFRLYSTALSKEYIKLLARGLAKFDNHNQINSFNFYESYFTQSTMPSIPSINAGGGTSSSYVIYTYRTAGSTKNTYVTQHLSGTQYTSTSELFELPKAGTVSINIPYCAVNYSSVSYAIYRWRYSNGSYTRYQAGSYRYYYEKYYVYLDLYDENESLLGEITLFSQGAYSNQSSTSSSSPSVAYIGNYNMGQSKTATLPDDIISIAPNAKYGRIKRVYAGSVTPQQMLLGYTYTQTSGGGHTQVPQYGTRNTILISQIKYKNERHGQSYIAVPAFNEDDSNQISLNESIAYAKEFIEI